MEKYSLVNGNGTVVHFSLRSTSYKLLTKMIPKVIQLAIGTTDRQSSYKVTEKLYLQSCSKD